MCNRKPSRMRREPDDNKSPIHPIQQCETETEGTEKEEEEEEEEENKEKAEGLRPTL